jgi:teichuronic acid biosynthesis glycosyltransferase TuaC
MNILFLSMTFPDANDRARGSYNLALCEALSRDHAVRVCAPRAWLDVMRTRLQGSRYRAGDEIRRSGIIAEYPTYWYVPRLSQNQSGPLLDRSCRPAIRALTRDFRPDLVLSYWAHPDGEAGMRIARRLNAKSAVIVGGSDALILPHLSGRGPRVRRVLVESNYVFTVSDGLRDAVLDLGANPDRVHVTYQGINPDVFHIGEQKAARRSLGHSTSKPLLLWVGRMVDVKRIDVLLAACRLLQQSSFEFQLCLVGDGPLRKRYEREVRESPLRDSVRFVGSVPYRETAAWYRAADATLLTSDSEGLPNVLRESLACGTPFVSTDVGSIREIGDPDCSILTPKGDAQRFSEGIRAILGGRYRQAAQGFRPRTWAECADDMVGIVQSGTCAHPSAAEALA